MAGSLQYILLLTLYTDRKCYKKMQCCMTEYSICGTESQMNTL